MKSWNGSLHTEPVLRPARHRLPCAPWSDGVPVVPEQNWHVGRSLGSMNSATYGPTSKRQRRRQRLSYRLRPPRPTHFNRFQRTVWRLQRLVLGDTSRRLGRIEPK